MRRFSANTSATKRRTRDHGPVTPDARLHEPLTFLAFLAAITHRIELVTGVLVLPMRQTVLVATGDSGADDCQDGRGASVNILASAAAVTAVGGTALDPAFDAQGNATRYAGETVWNDASVAGS